jgi:hypothetical protein
MVGLDSTFNSKMVSETLRDPLGHLLSGFRYRITHRYIHAPSPMVLGVSECVKKSHIGCKMT